MMGDSEVVVYSDPDKPIVELLKRGGWYTVVQIHLETQMPTIIIEMVLSQLAYIHGLVENREVPGSTALEYAWIDE